MARAMVLATRVACKEEGDGDGGKSDSNKGGGRAKATRAMVMKKANNNQPVTGLTKVGVREHQRGDHTTTTVGNNERQELAADNDGSDEEGEVRVERAMVTSMSADRR
jgi:hypothetical protein